MSPRTEPLSCQKSLFLRFPDYLLIAIVGFLLPLLNELIWRQQVELIRFFYLIPSSIVAYGRGFRGSLLAAAAITGLTGMMEVYYATTGINVSELDGRLMGMAMIVLITLADGWIMEKLLTRHRALELVNEGLRLQALTDELTGLYNYRYLTIRLDEELRRAMRLNTQLSLVMIDIDHFKCYNDTHGHPMGDQLLVTLGRILQENVRLVDTVARYGGEEFAIILADTDGEGALVAARRILDAIGKHPFPGRSTQPDGKITVSMGIASFPADAGTKEELIQRADKALYFVKTRNKNSVQLYFDFDSLIDS